MTPEQLKQVIDAEKPAGVFVDIGEVGAGVYDRMPCSVIVVPVNFGSASFEPAPLDERGRPVAVRSIGVPKCG